MRNLPVKQFNEIKKTFQVKKCGNIETAIDHVSVYEWLGLKSPVNQWIRKAIKKYGFVDGVDYIKIESSKNTVSRELQNGFVENINNLQTKTVSYYCSKDMVKQLAMVASSDKGQIVRLYFLDCENIAQQLLLEKEERAKLKVEFRPMTDAVLAAHEEPKPYHYSNECDMINRIVLGMSASQYRKHHGMDKNESVRDYMTELQMKAVIDLQRANTVLIEFGEEFKDRKIKLQSLFDKKFCQALINEIIEIEA